MGFHYVYVLIDPRSSAVFYVGKGISNRIAQHFTPGGATRADSGMEPREILAAAEATDDGGATSPKIRMIRELREAGYTEQDIARVIVRRISEREAFTVESCLIQSVFSRPTLTNLQGGHHPERFRPGRVGVQEPDLSATPENAAFDLAQVTVSGNHYVYVLIDPSKDEVFYVGKGIGNRAVEHIAEARNMNDSSGVDACEKLECIAKLLDQGHSEIGICRVVARDLTEQEAFLLETLFIKFVYGRGTLTNQQAGHRSGLVRAKEDWELRHGFDIPWLTARGAPRRELLDQFLSEGVDRILLEVADAVQQHTNFDCHFEGPRLVGAGELCIDAKIDGRITLRIQSRSKLAVQVALVAKDRPMKHWLVCHFTQLKKFPYKRKDFRYTPLTWSGAQNVTTDVNEAARRALLLIKLAQVQNLEDLGENKEELLGNLPFDRSITGQERAIQNSCADSLNMPTRVG